MNRCLSWVLMMAAGVLAATSPAETGAVPMPDLGYDSGAFPVVKPLPGGGVIDMENRTVRVVAWGTCDREEVANDAECIVSAQAVAKASGLQNLSEIIGDLDIGLDYTSNMINQQTGEIVIRSEAFLRGAREVSGRSPNGVDYNGYRYMPDNSILAWVTLELPLATPTLGKAFDNPKLRALLDERIKARGKELKVQYESEVRQPNQQTPEPMSPPPDSRVSVDEKPDSLVAQPQLTPPEPAVGPPAETPATSKDPHTGLIIDGSGFASAPVVQAPAVISHRGRQVYDINQLAREVRLSGDIIRYCPSVEKARLYRDKVGESPLLVTAADIHKDGIIVVSEQDAVRIAEANTHGDFLRFGRVILVYR